MSIGRGFNGHYREGLSRERRANAVACPLSPREALADIGAWMASTARLLPEPRRTPAPCRRSQQTWPATSRVTADHRGC